MKKRKVKGVIVHVEYGEGDTAECETKTINGAIKFLKEQERKCEAKR